MSFANPKLVCSSVHRTVKKFHLSVRLQPHAPQAVGLANMSNVYSYLQDGPTSEQDCIRGRFGVFVSRGGCDNAVGTAGLLACCEMGSNRSDRDVVFWPHNSWSAAHLSPPPFGPLHFAIPSVERRNMCRYRLKRGGVGTRLRFLLPGVPRHCGSGLRGYQGGKMVTGERPE